MIRAEQKVSRQEEKSPEVLPESQTQGPRRLPMSPQTVIRLVSQISSLFVWLLHIIDLLYCNIL